MTDIAISAIDLVKDFKVEKHTVRAIDGLSLQVAAGHTYGLIGPDGSGKTTTTRLLLGLLGRTSGESRVLGFDSERDSYSIHEHVGYIAQQFARPAQLTVMENMQFFASLQGVPADAQKKRIPELLKFAGLSDFPTRLAGRLSGGMKKKLALACSLIHEPQVVLLDEPTLGVDPVSRREFWNLLANLQVEKGMTIFVCTPYMDEAERCSQVGLLYAGRIIASGTPAQIKAGLPGHLLEVTPGNFPAARQLVESLPGVLELQTYGNKLHVFVDDVPRGSAELESAFAAAGLAYDSMREIEVRMEEAYISLVNKESLKSKV